MLSKESDKWDTVMKEEIDSLHNNNTWVLVELPAGEKVIQSEWVYKTKCGNNGYKSIRYLIALALKYLYDNTSNEC